MQASQNGHRDVALLLLDQGANVNAADKVSHGTLARKRAEGIGQ
jgi:hypothetical protein